LATSTLATDLPYLPYLPYLPCLPYLPYVPYVPYLPYLPSKFFKTSGTGQIHSPYFSSTPICTLWFSQDRHISKNHAPKTQKWISRRTLNQQCQQSRLASPSFFSTFLCLCSTAICLSPNLYLSLSPHSTLTIMLPLFPLNVSLLYTVLSLSLSFFRALPYFYLIFSFSFLSLQIYYTDDAYFVVKNISSRQYLCSPGSSVGRALGF
jgi:hypothetical protein